MARVSFTPHLKRHLHCPDVECEGTTVREVLENVFQKNVALRGYILDDQSRLRKHVVVFINGTAVADRVQLSDAVEPHAEVYVMQALSGG